MPKAKIEIRATSDWSRVIISSPGAHYVKDAGADLLMQGQTNIWRLLYSHREAGMWRARGVNDIVTLQGEVDAPANTIQVSMGHGDNGWVEISSPVDTKTNNVNLGDGQNFQSYTLTIA